MSRFDYSFMTKGNFNRFVARFKEIPICIECKNVLVIGSDYIRRRTTHNSYNKKYCIACGKRLNII